MRYARCKELFGEDFKKLQNAKVLILGVGGVGSYALDCLYKSGVSNITIVDYDTYDQSNLNRQIGASGNIGKSKTEVLCNIYPGVDAIEQKMDLDWVDNFDFDPYDLVIDAADTTKVKVQIAKKCYKKLIMSLGSAKRYDFSKIEVTTIFKTHGDALARKIRNELKRAKFNKNFTVVFSSEEPKCKDKGSFVGVTGAFGLAICSEAIKKLLALK
jgi:tRNA A37 threonylcarbamoyladenosine dehydratase